MYHIPYFKEKDEAIVKQFMQQHRFIVLCGTDEAGKPVATQVPVLMEEKDNQLFLQGHVMKNTDHHKAFETNPHVLALFTGPHSYVSAGWYQNPQQASTWNYMTVQVQGILQFLHDDQLTEILDKTTAYFENNIQSPSLFGKLPLDYVSRLCKAIVAFEIRVTGVDNVFKLSQNRDEASYHNIIHHLLQQNEDARTIAGEMKQRAASLFSQNLEQV